MRRRLPVKRRGRDLNPRDACTPNSFRDCPVRPLRHPSMKKGSRHRKRSWRDSNPRYGLTPYNTLAGCRLQPLGHISGISCRTLSHDHPGSDQSIGGSPCSANHSSTRAKCPQPKKPVYADSGDGCAARSTRCFDSSTSAALDWAWRPHNRNATRPGRSETARIAAPVIGVQPAFACDPASPARTDNAVLSSSTPRCVHALRSPCSGGTKPNSLDSSR